jgi:hypothetical protein
MEQPNFYKPKSLPQVSAPFSYVAYELNDMGQPYEMLGVNVDSINPSQAFIDSDLVYSLIDKLKNGEELKAIWLDKDNNSIDGHHRHVAYKLNKNSHVPAVRLNCDKETAIKVLKEIQSKYDRENNSKFLNELFKDGDTSTYVREKDLETKKETIKAFKEKPIKQKAITGNFFSLKEVPNWKGYEIEFSALVNSDQIDKKIKKHKNPPLALAMAWFPDLNIEQKAKEMEMPLEEFILTIVAEKARTKGIDGILYGDKLLQTIDEK